MNNYNYLNYIIEIDEQGNEKKVDAIPGVRLNLLGSYNTIIFHKGTRFNNCIFTCADNNSKITIKKSKFLIKNLEIHSRNSVVYIGNDFSCWSCEMWLNEPFSQISIGNDCMFASEIAIYATDIHKIYDAETKKLINKCRPIKIGNHVWVGRRVGILKGFTIFDNSIIAFGTICTGCFDISNILIAGNPCQLKKRNINWER